MGQLVGVPGVIGVTGPLCSGTGKRGRGLPDQVGKEARHLSPSLGPTSLERAWQVFDHLHDVVEKTTASAIARWPCGIKSRSLLLLSYVDRMPWPGFEPGCLAALPPQSGGNGLASSAIMVNRSACRWSSEQQAVPACPMQRDGSKIAGAKRGPTASGARRARKKKAAAKVPAALQRPPASSAC